MTSNFFIRPDIVVYNSLTNLFPDINKADVIEWSLEAYLENAADGGTLQKFLEVELVYDETTGLALLPCNIERILDVYNSNNSPVKYQLQSSGRHIKINDDSTKIFINYLGAWIDEEGYFVIPKHFRNAARLYCISKQLEPEAIVDDRVFQKQQIYLQKFSYSCGAFRNSAKMKDRKHYENLRVIKFNMIPTVGRHFLFHKQYE